MVGKAWRYFEPQSTGKIIQDMVLPRSLYARKADLDSGLWIPIRASKAGYVFECLWNSSPDTSPAVMVEQLAKVIVALLERKSSRSRLRRRPRSWNSTDDGPAMRRPNKLPRTRVQSPHLYTSDRWF
jgi:hypothetical protein